MTILPLATFGIGVALIIFLGFRDKAKYRAAHPEEFGKKKV